MVEQTETDWLESCCMKRQGSCGLSHKRPIQLTCCRRRMQACIASGCWGGVEGQGAGQRTPVDEHRAGPAGLQTLGHGADHGQRGSAQQAQVSYALHGQLHEEHHADVAGKAMQKGFGAWPLVCFTAHIFIHCSAARSRQQSHLHWPERLLCVTSTTRQLVHESGAIGTDATHSKRGPDST